MLVLYFVAGYAVLTLAYRLLYFRKRVNYKGKHVAITGASEGICRSLAEELYSQGAKVTILARTASKLQKAKEEIQSTDARNNQSSGIEFAVIDVTVESTIKPAFERAVELHGDIDVLILGAGCAHPGYFIDQEAETFRWTMDLNYMGIVRCVQAVLPMMLKSDKKTRQQIVMIGSACSITSFLGYASYSPSKFAVRGLADALRNELRGTGVSVHIAYPPDTDTPGFAEENKKKPKETFQISPPDVYSARSVCRSIVDGMQRAEYHIWGPDLVQNLLVASMSGLTPRDRWAPITIIFQPLIAIIEVAFIFRADLIAKGYGKKLKERYVLNDQE